MVHGGGPKLDHVLINDNLSSVEHHRELNRRANPPAFHERLDRWLTAQDRAKRGLD